MKSCFRMPDATVHLIYQYSISKVMKSMLLMHRHTWIEMQRSLPALFNWNGSVTLQRIGLPHVRILNRIQLAEHWGGILCKFLITSVHDPLTQRLQPCAHTHTHIQYINLCVCIHTHTHGVMLYLLPCLSVHRRQALNLSNYRTKLLKIIHHSRCWTSGSHSRVKLLFFTGKK